MPALFERSVLGLDVGSHGIKAVELKDAQTFRYLQDYFSWVTKLGDIEETDFGGWQQWQEEMY